jgi:hypothetical protein
LLLGSSIGEANCNEIPGNALDAVNKCPRVTMPGLHMLLTPEKIFYKVKRTLTTLHSTMSEQRFEALSLLQAHCDRVANMSTEDIQWRCSSWQSSANALPVSLSELLVALPVYFETYRFITDIEVILYFVPDSLALPIHDADL